jgi:hypothetical protein
LQEAGAKSLAETLIVNEEEGLVFDDWASEPASELAIERTGNESACNGIGESLCEGIPRFLCVAVAEPETATVEVVAS